jgi:hypothetical protein
MPHIGLAAFQAGYNLGPGHGQKIGYEFTNMPAGTESKDFFGLSIDMREIPFGVGNDNAIGGGVEDIAIANGGCHQTDLLSEMLAYRRGALSRRKLPVKNDRAKASSFISI